jgi:hypothetical protein
VIARLPASVRFGLLLVLAFLGFVILVALVGWLFFDWRTSTQFSNGFFILGAIVAVFGAYSAMGGFGMRGNAGVNIARTASPASLEERNKQMFADIRRGIDTAFILTLVGLLLIGVAVLLPNLF